MATARIATRDEYRARVRGSGARVGGRSGWTRATPFVTSSISRRPHARHREFASLTQPPEEGPMLQSVQRLCVHLNPKPPHPL